MLHRITIQGMNQTIYFRKDIWDKFKDEENKSEMVNELLAFFYEEPWNLTSDKSHKPDAYLLSPKLAKENPDLVKQFDKLAEPLAPTRKDNGLCKVHGLPLDARGRCLQKGCRYS